jgi:hypothetical protein
MKHNYRKIYETYYGPIPTDDSGRTHEIHHMDGNHNNNNITNLKLVTIKEHYDIHYSQRDWGACQAIALRLEQSSENISKLSSKSNQERVLNGTHHLLGGSQQRAAWSKRREEGTDSYNGDRSVLRKSALAQTAAGNNALVGGEVQRKNNQLRIKNGTHHLLGSAHNKKRLAAGNHPSQIKTSCLLCRALITAGGMSQHFGGKKCRNSSVKLTK